MRNTLSKLDSHHKATLQILITAILWGTTFVVVRIGVDEIGPLSLAGIRFFTAGLLLLPFLMLKKIPNEEIKRNILPLALVGILSYAIGNGSLNYALQFLPATLVSFLMSFITPIILIFSIIWLKEFPTPVQTAGLVFVFFGIILYFYPQQIPFHAKGFGILMLGLLGFALQTTLGRFLARGKNIQTITLTTIPLIIGGGILLIVSFFVEGFPVISQKTVLILGWLIFFNTIIGQLLYSSAIAEITAIQINLVLNLSPFFTAIFAWFLLGEQLGITQVAAMGTVFIGTYLVQRKPGNSSN
jgi:drug/metabolite transporter (DMT)-like permease